MPKPQALGEDGDSRELLHSSGQGIAAGQPDQLSFISLFGAGFRVRTLDRQAGPWCPQTSCLQCASLVGHMAMCPQHEWPLQNKFNALRRRQGYLRYCAVIALQTAAALASAAALHCRTAHHASICARSWHTCRCRMSSRCGFVMRHKGTGHQY